MQATTFFLHSAATGTLSLLSLLGLAQAMPQSGLARLAPGQGKVGSSVLTTTSPLGQP